MEEGFWYGMMLVGRVVPPTDGSTDTNDTAIGRRNSTATPLSASQRLIAATHLCSFLRRLILRKTGLSSSGGVAGCKMIAKMMVGVGKPAGQAVWVGNGGDASQRDESGRVDGVSGTAGDKDSRTPTLQAFLDPQPVRNIQGYGSGILSTLRTAYPTLPEAPTIYDVRPTIPQAAFPRLFPSQGDMLWDLLHGIDNAPVKPSPQFPAQISVEDSYAASLWRTAEVIRGQAVILMEKLLGRMEEELAETEDGYMKGISFHPPTIRDVKWVRYPSQIRFNIRTFTSTQSKSTSIPAFVFDTAVERRDRAEKAMKVLGDRILQSLLGKGRDGAAGKEYEVYVWVFPPRMVLSLR